MQRLLIAFTAALLYSTSTFAQSTVADLATSTTSPLPAGSCVYVDQGPGTDTKLCSGWAAAFGALTAANNLSDLNNAATARTNLGLGNVNNTSDANKPVSTATQSALDLKAPLVSPALVTPDLGVPTALDLSNATGTPSAAGPFYGLAFPSAADLLGSDGTQFLLRTLGAGLAISSNTIIQTNVINTQAGASYPIVATDGNKTVQLTNGSPTTPTIIAGGTAGTGYSTFVACGSACTLTPLTGTINGAATLVGAAGQGLILDSDGTSDWMGYVLPAADPSNAANMTSGLLAVARGGTGLASGTSGGVLAYTGSGTLVSSGALTANLPVIGGGAGAAPTVGTRSGNSTAFVTTTGTQTSGRCVEIDANGNHIAAAAACGGGSGASYLHFFSSGTGTYSTTNVFIGIAAPNTSHVTSGPIVVPFSGTLSDLSCWTSVAPGAGITHTFTLSHSVTTAGVPAAAADNTNQQVSIAGAGIQTSTVVNNVGVAVGRYDTVSIHVAISSGTPTSRVSCQIKLA